MSIRPETYRVFVGSPQGLEEERESFYERLIWFSQHYGAYEELAFQPVGWEQVTGGYGRPQFHINKVLAECDYAVFILHDRYGSPPGGNHASGTEEEFELAKKLYKRKTIKGIALFLKEIDPEKLAKPDEQLAAVLSFRIQIEKKRQFLYKNYSSLNQFRDLLVEYLLSWCGDHRRRTQATPSTFSLRAQQQLGMAVVRNHRVEDYFTLPPPA